MCSGQLGLNDHGHKLLSERMAEVLDKNESSEYPDLWSYFRESNFQYFPHIFGPDDFAIFLPKPFRGESEMLGVKHFSYLTFLSFFFGFDRCSRHLAICFQK